MQELYTTSTTTVSL